MLYQFLGDFKFLIRYSDICIHNMYVQAYLIKLGKHFAHNNSVLQNKKSKGQKFFFFFFFFIFESKYNPSQCWGQGGFKTF